MIAACQDEMMSKLSPQTKLWFGKHGAKEIWNLKYREGWAFIGTMGSGNAIDKKCAEI